MKYYQSDLWRNYVRTREDLYNVLIPDHAEVSMVSEENWLERGGCFSGEDIGIRVNQGDICYMDFGQQYLNEAGYQHFGLVMSIYAKKALVIPMTSNPATCAKAYDPIDNPQGKKNLMQIGKVRGLYKNSVLFLNDLRFVNTARVIDVKAHVPVTSPLFRTVQKRMMEVLFANDQS
ncbi:MAG: hypothetical protein IJM63_10065 [Solobacterium sp.]|nr:hypothetical protein [Solobacterium sp.]MBQ9824831.1 hypothetical protein [Solobacterium sp.]